MLVSTAWHDFEAARENQEKMERCTENDGAKGTLAHGYYANIGGFIIRGVPSDTATLHSILTTSIARSYSSSETTTFLKLFPISPKTSSWINLRVTR